MSELEPLLERFAELVADRVAARLAARRPDAGTEPDRALSLEEAAARLGVSTAWLRRRASTLPFTIKHGHRTRVFSAAGIARWLERKTA